MCAKEPYICKRDLHICNICLHKSPVCVQKSPTYAKAPDVKRLTYAKETYICKRDLHIQSTRRKETYICKRARHTRGSIAWRCSACFLCMTRPEFVAPMSSSPPALRWRLELVVVRELEMRPLK